MTNGRRKSWNVVVRHHAKVPTTSYIEWQPNSGIKCIFQQLSWTSTYSTKYQNFVQKPICNPPLTRFPLTRYPLISQAEPNRTWAFQFSSWNWADNMYVNRQQILVPIKNCNKISYSLLLLFKTIDIFRLEYYNWGT